jgi:hypothetical protein
MPPTLKMILKNYGDRILSQTQAIDAIACVHAQFIQVEFMSAHVYVYTSNTLTRRGCDPGLKL